MSAPQLSGAQVRQVRHALGLTRDEFADLLLLSRTTVYRWEKQEAPSIGAFHGALIRALRDRLARAAAAPPINAGVDSFVTGQDAMRARESRGALAGLLVLMNWAQGY